MSFARRIKGWLKRNLRRARARYDRLFRAFSPADLAGALRASGVRPGDVLFAHVAFNDFRGFSGSPSEVIGALREALGEDGTLLMPTMPFTGTAVDYLGSGKPFDVRRTASRMGIVTELFRRLPDTLRSAHPTHSVAASGAKAALMLEGHDRAATPCGVHSPYHALMDHDAKIALLGTGIGALTFFHTLEEILEPLMPRSPFTKEHYTVSYLGRNGEKREARMRLFDPGMSKRRDLRILERALRAAGHWTERRVGGLSLVILEARKVHAVARDMAMQEVFCYRP
ncbi:MAG: AAC(3) family N-acetyltransferase [Alphaproteobacteria bacterium]